MSQYPEPVLVELLRTFDEEPWYGFLIAESEQLVVVHLVSDRFNLDGYCAFRREDIEYVDEAFDKLDLIQRALRIKGQQPLPRDDLDLSSMKALMESAQRLFGVLLIDRELVADSVEVGTIRMTSADTYVLRWLSVLAEWENDDRPFRYRDVTRLEFGAEYEQTLLAVARSREEAQNIVH